MTVFGWGGPEPGVFFQWAPTRNLPIMKGVCIHSVSYIVGAKTCLSMLLYGIKPIAREPTSADVHIHVSCYVFFQALSVRSFKTATGTSCTGCPHQLYDLSLTLGGNPPRSGGVVGHDVDSISSSSGRCMLKASSSGSLSPSSSLGSSLPNAKFPKLKYYKIWSEHEKWLITISG